jgi:hypothetical protein
MSGGKSWIQKFIFRISFRSCSGRNWLRAIGEKRARASPDCDLKRRERFAIRDRGVAYEGNVEANAIFLKMHFVQHPWGQNLLRSSGRLTLVTIGPDRSFAR